MPRAAGPPLATAPAALANRSTAVTCDPAGTIALTDLATGTSLPGLLRLVDETDQGDLYTFSRVGEPDPGTAVPASQSILAWGPLIGAVESRWTARFRSATLDARSVVSLHRDSPLVHLRLELEQRGCHHRLRLRFPVGTGHLVAGGTLGIDRAGSSGGGGARRGGAGGSDPSGPADTSRRRAGRPRLVVLAPGFFEYQWTRRGDLLITAFRAVGELSRADLPERPGHAAWPTPTPDAQEPGPHTIDLALAIFPPGAEGLPDRVEQMWEEAFLPIQAFWRRC